MPELPDIEAYLFALRERILDQTLLAVRLGSPFLLRTVDPSLASATHQKVTRLRRIGKRIAIGLENGVWIVLHLMIAGRLHWQPPNAKLVARRTLAAFDFNTGPSLSPRPAPNAAPPCTLSPTPTLSTPAV